jgi:hypothetical protein
MSTTSYAFGQSATSQTEQTSGSSQMNFWLYENATISNISVAASQKNTNQDSFVTMILTTSDGIRVQETQQIYNGRQYCNFSNTLSVNRGTWFNITFYLNNAYAYYDNTRTTQYLTVGYSGNSAVTASILVYDSKFTLTYDPIWTVDAQNDGYARIIGYAPPANWEGFEKDEDGYPTNWAAWKLDDQNEGYPWPTGFLPSHIVVGGIYKKVNGTFVPVQIYKKVNGTLVPAQLYKKVNGNLIPIF